MARGLFDCLVEENPMKTSTFLSGATAALVSAAITVLAACSSSSSGSSSVPTCKGATQTTGAGSAACTSCTQSSCASQISAVETSCSAYVTCYEGCQCSDLTCLEGCLSKIDSTCENADGPLTSCLSQSCAAPCGMTAPDAG
jgi:hypothetical protein